MRSDCRRLKIVTVISNSLVTYIQKKGMQANKFGITTVIHRCSQTSLKELDESTRKIVCSKNDTEAYNNFR